MNTIILSPHMDDAVFSCGGWIWDQTRQGRQVEIWTICAGDPPRQGLSLLAQQLHQNWRLDQDAVPSRRAEDLKACQVLGAEPRHFQYLDCIYRQSLDGEPYYTEEEDLFGGLDPREKPLVDELRRTLEKNLPSEARIVAPLGIGNHVDHELTRKAASRLEREVLYYADIPYALKGEGGNILGFMEPSPDWEPVEFRISPEGMDGWLQAALQYDSQLSTFWSDQAELETEVGVFVDFGERFRLWRALDS